MRDTALQVRTFGIGNAVMAFLLGALVATPLVFITALNHPFSGISVPPDAYVSQLERFRHIP